MRTPGHLQSLASDCFEAVNLVTLRVLIATARFPLQAISGCNWLRMFALLHDRTATGTQPNNMWKKLLIGACVAVIKAIGQAAMKMAPEVLKNIKNWWTGKNIAIIGATASGKNSLFSKLQRKDPPSEHIQTRGADEVGTFKFQWPLPDRSKIEFYCRRSINVGGEIDERERYWLQSCAHADVIFYLVDVTRLQDAPATTMKRIESDLKWLATHLPSMKASSCIHILVNKVDTVVADCEPAQVTAVVSSAVGPHLDKLEQLSKVILGPHFKRISGISPISMTDGHLFSTCFTGVLQDVFNARSTVA